MLETPTINEIKLHLRCRKCGGKLIVSRWQRDGVIMWLQNQRSRHERQINFPELCMSDSFAIWHTSFDICRQYHYLHVRIHRLEIIFVRAQRDYYL